MGKANLNPDFKAFFESLNSAGVRYLVVGGYAVIFYGYHRVTKDIDVWIATDAANAAGVAGVMQSFGGFPASKTKPSMFQKAGMNFMFGREPVRIDVLTGPSGVEFDACYSRRNVVEWDGVRVPLIALEDLLANKKASGRLKDLADLEALSHVSPPGVKKRKKRK